MLHFGLLELGLEQDFESDDELGLLLPGQIHIAKFALAEGPANVKVGQAPSAPMNGEYKKMYQTTIPSQTDFFLIQVYPKCY